MITNNKVKRIILVLTKLSGLLWGMFLFFPSICTLFSSEFRAMRKSRGPEPLTFDDCYYAIISIIIGLAFIINFFLPYLRSRIRDRPFKYLNILVFTIISFALLKWVKDLIMHLIGPIMNHNEDIKGLENIIIDDAFTYILPVMLYLMVCLMIFLNWLLLCKEVFKKK